MFDEHVELFERFLIQKHFDTLPCRQLATLMLGGDAALAATKARFGAPLFELPQDVVHQEISQRLLVCR
jgi:hypothetical protein